jgi:antitoxin CptB
MTDDAETRRRRAVYRACHRGTKEMDWILGRFAQAALPAMPLASLGLFERMLSLPDPDLQDMILHPELAPAGEYAELVAAVRAFHGLEGAEQE